MKITSKNHPLYKDIFEALVDREIITRKHRIEIVNTTVKGDWATVEVDIIRPRFKKPCIHWDLAIYMPSSTIYWSESTHYSL